jgi:hypothetical protein
LSVVGPARIVSITASLAGSARVIRARTECGTATKLEEPAMADKSPRHSASKKSGKSIKEKRAEKKAAASGGNEHLSIPPHKK